MKTIEVVALNKAIGDVHRMGIPVKGKFGYAMSLNAARTEPIVRAFEESRMRLLNEFGKKGEDGNFVLVEGTDQVEIAQVQDFSAAFLELTEEDVLFEPHRVDVDFVPELPAPIIASLMPMLRSTDE